VEKVKLKLSQLCLRRPTPRKTSSDPELERSIIEDGILFPPLIRKLSDDVFEVIDGERRVGIAKDTHQRGRLKKEHEKVVCVVIEAPTNADVAYWRLVANLHNNLPSEEVTFLYEQIGQIPLPIADHPEKFQGMGRYMDGLNDLIIGIARRKGSIRGSRRILMILEAIRDHFLYSLQVPETLARIRNAEGDAS